MRKNTLLWTLVIPVLISSCTVIPMLSGGDSSNKGSKSDYREDLSVHRPAFEPLERQSQDLTDSAESMEIDSSFYTPVNDSVNYVLDSIARIRLTDNKVTGYTILVYSSMSREESRKALGKLYNILPDASADLVYSQPYFRVKTGKFMHEILAYDTLKKIKSEFPSAVIVPENYKISEPDKDER